MQQDRLAVVEELSNRNSRLQTQLDLVQLQLIEAKGQLQQEQTRRQHTEDRALAQVRRAAAVNVEIIKANGALKQQVRLSKTQADELKIENACLRAALQVRGEEDRNAIARLAGQLQAAQHDLQGKRQRQVPPVLQQHKQDLSRGDSAPEMLPRDGSKQEQDVAVLASKRQVAGSGQPSTSKVGETNMVELTDVAQQANVRRERTADNLKATQSRADIVHATASAVSANTKAAAVPTFQPSSHCRAEHLVAWASAAAADESLAGAVNNTQLNTGPAIVTAEASSNRSQSAPSSANAGSMSTPTPGISDRRDSVGQQALLHMPEESRHSKGLQQLWNCVAHTPLTVPSPCSMTGNCRMQHRRQTSFEEQGHQRVLVPDLATPSQVLQSSTASSSAASEVTEGATALSVGLAVEDAVTPDRSAEGKFPQRRSGRSKPRVGYGEPKLSSKLRQGDAFTFGSAESSTRTAMRRRSVIPKRKGLLANPDRLNTPSNRGTSLRLLSDTGDGDKSLPE